jgi:putative addiction module killer protein
MDTLVFRREKAFDTWLAALRDLEGKGRILARLAAARAGNFGDCRPLGGGLSEMRIHAGPGYRVYFRKADTFTSVLLCGGDKSTQQSDIQRARSLARNL